VNHAAITVPILAVFMIATVGLGIAARRGRASGDMTEWSLGGRSMGLALTLVLVAGETYTSFSYLGAAGWSYTNGISGLYVVGYLGIGMAISYLIAPIFWSYAHRHGLHNISDIVAHRFDSPWLGALVAITSTVFLLPYIQLQFTGLGVVVSTVSYGAIGLTASYLIAFVVAECFVLVSGLRGSGWVSVLKDGLVVITLAVVFVYVPLHFFHGYGPMLHRLVEQKQRWLTLPGPANHALGIGWYMSTVLLNGVVYSMLPTQIAAFLGAKNTHTLRRNAMIMPFYQVLLFVPVLLGLGALFVVPGLKDSNLALFTMIGKGLPPWFFAVVGAAGALSAIVPTAVFMLVIGTMWGRSVLGLHRRTAARQKELSQAVTLIAGVLALVLTFAYPAALVRLSLLSYEGMAQLLPLVLLSLFSRRMSAPAGAAGAAVGIAVVSALVFTHHDPVFGLNAGLVGLLANLIVVVAITALRPADAPADRLAQPESPIEAEPVAQIA